MLLTKTQLRTVLGKIQEALSPEKGSATLITEGEERVTKQFLDDLSKRILASPALTYEQLDHIVQSTKQKQCRILFNCTDATDEELKECLLSYSEANHKSNYVQFLKEYDLLTDNPQLKPSLILKSAEYLKNQDSLYSGFKRYMAREHGDKDGSVADTQIRNFEKYILEYSAIRNASDATVGIINNYINEKASAQVIGLN